jgi:uncharacterized protein with GYD domain
MIELSYTPEAWAKLIRNPQNRIEAVRPAVEKMGGSIVNAWFAFGEYDLITVVEVPDNTTAAAISLAFTAGGALKACKTTVLLSIAEGTEAMRKAGQSEYRPPSS